MLNVDKKLSYRKQIARQQRTQSKSTFLGEFLTEGGGYRTPVVVNAAESINFRVE